MVEYLPELLKFFASYTGGINVQVSLNSASQNPEHLKELFKAVKTQIDTKEFDLNKITEIQEKFYNASNEEQKMTQEKMEEIQDDDTLDDKYYLINYEEEPFIPQQHYFNSFYMVDQVMYDQEEAQQALQQDQEQEPVEGEMEYQEQDEYQQNYEQQEMDPEDYDYEEGYEQEDPRFK